MGRPIRLTPRQERLFREWWTGGVPVTRIAVSLGLTHDGVNRVRARLGLEARTPRTRAAPAVPVDRDPTPAEIAAACAELRAKHLAKRLAEPVNRRYRDDEDGPARVYRSDGIDLDE